MNEDEQKDETKTAIFEGVVGTGIACAGVSFLAIREGWDFHKWDEENKKFAGPGLMK